MNTPLSPSELTALINQTLEFAYPTVIVIGELASFKIAKEKWVYTDIKDDNAKLRCFGTVFQLPGPLEDGMMVEIIAEPRLHPQFGFSLNIRSLRPKGEGSIKKAANLLKLKLEKEGLFAESRKRSLPYPPQRLGLITSVQSAAYADFIKILSARWQGVEVNVANVQVQGQSAPDSIVEAINYFNQSSLVLDALVIIRGGGSIDDLAAFSTEKVTRSIASSRIPTIVGVGHEIDISLSGLVADLRASTPSNAAELLFPDKKDIKRQLNLRQENLNEIFRKRINDRKTKLKEIQNEINHMVGAILELKRQYLVQARSLLESVHPKATLRRGYALVQSGNKMVTSIKQIRVGQKVGLTMYDGTAQTRVEKVQ